MCYVIFADNLKINVRITWTTTMSYPPYGGQGGYQPGPAGGYPQATGQPTFPVQCIVLNVSGLSNGLCQYSTFCSWCMFSVLCVTCVEVIRISLQRCSLADLLIESFYTMPSLPCHICKLCRVVKRSSKIRSSIYKFEFEFSFLAFAIRGVHSINCTTALSAWVTHGCVLSTGGWRGNRNWDGR